MEWVVIMKKLDFKKFTKEDHKIFKKEILPEPNIAKFSRKIYALIERIEERELVLKLQLLENNKEQKQSCILSKNT